MPISREKRDKGEKLKTWGTRMVAIGLAGIQLDVRLEQKWDDPWKVAGRGARRSEWKPRWIRGKTLYKCDQLTGRNSAKGGGRDQVQGKMKKASFVLNKRRVTIRGKSFGGEEQLGSTLMSVEEIYSSRGFGIR